MLNEFTSKRVLYVLDDGWRYEKQEVVYFLRDRGVLLDIVTHDQQTYDRLKDDFHVRLIPIHSLKKSWRYRFSMFFAKELDTKTLQLFNRLKYHDASFPIKCMVHIRSLVGKLGLRRKTYCEVLSRLYKGSQCYADILVDYDLLLFSPVNVIDKRVIYEAKNRGIPIISWVFSWDNPMKDNEFIPDADRYLVWNEQNAKDLEVMFDIERSRVDIVGPVQFDFLFERRKRPPAAKQGYVMYACSMGLSYYIEQEIEIALKIREILDEIAPGTTLLVRPYPFRDSASIYNKLERHPGIDVAHFGNFEGRRALISREDLDAKVEQIQRADCFINLASTIALEAAFTDTPILQLCYSYPHNFPACQDIARVLENDHLKYILNDKYPNMIHDHTALKQGLQRVLSGDAAPYLPYSEALRSFSDPLGVDSYKEQFLEKLRAIERV